MSSPCNKGVVSPQTNNTPLPCDGNQLQTECVLRTTAISYLGLPANSNLDEIINALVNALQDTRNRLELAEEAIEELQNP